MEELLFKLLIELPGRGLLRVLRIEDRVKQMNAEGGIVILSGMLVWGLVVGIGVGVIYLADVVADSSFFRR